MSASSLPAMYGCTMPLAGGSRSPKMPSWPRLRPAAGAVAAITLSTRAEARMVVVDEEARTPSSLRVSSPMRTGRHKRAASCSACAHSAARCVAQVDVQRGPQLDMQLRAHHRDGPAPPARQRARCPSEAKLSTGPQRGVDGAQQRGERALAVLALWPARRRARPHRPPPGLRRNPPAFCAGARLSCCRPASAGLRGRRRSPHHAAAHRLDAAARRWRAVDAEYLRALVEVVRASRKPATGLTCSEASTWSTRASDAFSAHGRGRIDRRNSQRAGRSRRRRSNSAQADRRSTRASA